MYSGWEINDFQSNKVISCHDWVGNYCIEIMYVEKISLKIDIEGENVRRFPNNYFLQSFTLG